MQRDLLTDEIDLIGEVTLGLMGRFEERGYEIYLVGGGVRRVLSGQRPINPDLTTNATPQQTQEVLKEFDTYYENDFGMVGLKHNDDIYEITTFRSEKGYSDFRRPDKVIWGKSLEEDIKRRDFTMNTMVMGRRDGKYKLIDTQGGLDDFERGIIRTVGNPKERFGEDALRMMRAVRFATTLSFQIEKETLEGIVSQAPVMGKISRERVRDELFKIIKSDYPADGIRLLINTGLMEHIIPELLEGKGVEQTGHHTLDVLDHMIESLRNCPASDPIVRLATLIHDIGKPRSKRWKCRSCHAMLKTSDLKTDNNLVCRVCGAIQTTRQSSTFYGHEVIGAKMAEKIADDLRLTNNDKKRVVTLVRCHMFNYQKEMTDAAIRRFIRRVGKENINDVLLLRIGDRKGGGSKTTNWRLMELQRRIGEQLFEPLQIRDMAVNGEDVMRVLGIKPGPSVGEILKKLFDEVLEDTRKNQRELLLERIKEIDSAK